MLWLFGGRVSCPRGVDAGEEVILTIIIIIKRSLDNWLRLTQSKTYLDNFATISTREETCNLRNISEVAKSLCNWSIDNYEQVEIARENYDNAKKGIAE